MSKKDFHNLDRRLTYYSRQIAKLCDCSVSIKVEWWTFKSSFDKTGYKTDPAEIRVFCSHISEGFYFDTPTNIWLFIKWLERGKK